LDDAFDAARRVIVPTSAGFQLQNPASQLNIDLDGRGSSLGAAPGGPIFELELKCLDYAVALFSPPERVTRQTARNRVTYAWGADLEE